MIIPSPSTSADGFMITHGLTPSTSVGRAVVTLPDASTTIEESVPLPLSWTVLVLYVEAVPLRFALIFFGVPSK